MPRRSLTLQRNKVLAHVVKLGEVDKAHQSSIEDDDPSAFLGRLCSEFSVENTLRNRRRMHNWISRYLPKNASFKSSSSPQRSPPKSNGHRRKSQRLDEDEDEEAANDKDKDAQAVSTLIEAAYEPLCQFKVEKDSIVEWMTPNRNTLKRGWSEWIRQLIMDQTPLNCDLAFYRHHCSVSEKRTEEFVAHGYCRRPLCCRFKLVKLKGDPNVSVLANGKPNHQSS